MTLPDITEIKDLAAVPALLAPYVRAHGPLFVFCEDVTGHLFALPSAAAQPGTELVCKIGPQGSLGVRRTGARIYPPVSRWATPEEIGSRRWDT